MAVVGRISAGDMMFELALDIGEEAAGTHAEEVWLHPVVAQFFLHEDEKIERLLSGSDSARRFESDFDASFVVIFADHAGHDEAHGDCGVDRLFSG